MQHLGNKNRNRWGALVLALIMLGQVIAPAIVAPQQVAHAEEVVAAQSEQTAQTSQTVQTDVTPPLVPEQVGASSAISAEVTDAPAEASVSSPEGAVAPEETPAAPTEAIVAPAESSAVPEESSAAPLESSAAPVESSAATAESSAATVESSVAPMESSAASVESVGASNDVSSVDQADATSSNALLGPMALPVNPIDEELLLQPMALPATQLSALQQIVMTHTKYPEDGNPPEYFPAENYQNMLYIDARKIGATTLVGGYVDITVPLDRIDKFIVPTTGVQMILSTKDFKDPVANTWTKRIYLSEIDSMVMAGFQYQLSFKDRIIPEGYPVTPIATLHAPEDPENLDANGNPQGEVIVALTGDQNPTAVSKYHEFYFRKTLNDNYKVNDNQYAFAGYDRDNDGFVDPGAESKVTFKFNSVTDVVLDRGIRSWGAGFLSMRAIEKITITDTLPTYTSKTGTRLAVFDPALNPGWTLQPDGVTVVYVADGTGMDPMKRMAELAMMDAALVLKFPEMQTTKAGTATTLAYETIKNSATFQLQPYGAVYDDNGNRLYDPKMDTIYADDITVRLTLEPLMKGLVSKASNQRSQVFLDPNQMTEVNHQYVMTLENKNATPMTNLVMEDFELDPRNFFVSMQIQSTDNLSDVLESVELIDANGNVTPVAYTLSSSTVTNYIRLDTETLDALKAQRDAWEALEDITAPKPTGVDAPKYTKLRINLKPEYQMEPGVRMTIPLNVGFLHPYQVTTADPTYTNKVKLQGTLLMPGDEPDIPFGDTEAGQPPVEASGFFKIYPKTQTITMTKGVRSTTNGATNVVGIGDDIVYQMGVDFTGLSKGTRIKNAKLVDLLPPGVEFRRIGLPTAGVVPTVVTTPNYNNTGRTRVEMTWANTNFLTRDVSGLSVYVIGKATQFLNNDPEGVLDESLNKVYFYADDLYGPDGILAQGNVVNNSAKLADEYGFMDPDAPFAGETVSAQAPIKTSLPLEVRARKWIRIDPTDAWTTPGIEVPYNHKFQYRLEVLNNGTSALQNIVLYDYLPRVGDTNMFDEENGAPSPRESGFSNYLDGPIQDVPAGYKVFYTNHIGPDMTPDNVVPIDGIWYTQSQVEMGMGWRAVTAFKIVQDPGVFLLSGSSLNFVVPMRSRLFSKTAQYAGATANNNFAVSYGGDSWGQSNTVTVALLRSILVRKVWDGPKLDFVKVQLMQNGKPYMHVNEATGVEEPWIITLDEAGEWYDVFYDIPSVDALGKKYEYTIVETSMGMYEHNADGSLVLVDEKPVIAREDAVAGINQSSYQPTITGTVETELRITNTYKPPTLPITLSLEWKNGENAEKPPVEMALVRVNADGTTTPVLDADGNPIVRTLPQGTTEVAFGEVPVFDPVTGEPITYSVVQTGLTPTWKELSIEPITPAIKEDGTTMSYSDFDPTQATDLNIHVVNEYVIPMVEITAKKVYDGGAKPYPNTWFQLYRNLAGETPTVVQDDQDPAQDIAPLLVANNENAESTVKWTDMPMTDLQGNVYTYSVKELNEAGENQAPINYQKTGEGDVVVTPQADGSFTAEITITNTYVIPRTTYTVEKKWIDGADDKPNVTLILQRRNGTAVDAGFKQTITLDETALRPDPHKPKPFQTKRFGRIRGRTSMRRILMAYPTPTTRRSQPLQRSTRRCAPTTCKRRSWMTARSYQRAPS